MEANWTVEKMMKMKGISSATLRLVWPATFHIAIVTSVLTFSKMERSIADLNEKEKEKERELMLVSYSRLCLTY